MDKDNHVMTTREFASQQDEKGDWLIDAVNLKVPNVRRLLRDAQTP